MPKVYIASKFKYGKKWKELQDAAYFYDHAWSGVEFVSRWFLNYYDNVPDEPQFCKIGWIHDIEDIAKADAVIVYSEAEDNLRGALVEAGAAIALDKYVIVVGEHPDYGNWQYHPNVHKVTDLDAALVVLRCLDFGRKDNG